MWKLLESAEEVQQKDRHVKIITCPHCQKPIPVEMDIKVKVE